MWRYARTEPEFPKLRLSGQYSKVLLCLASYDADSAKKAEAAEALAHSVIAKAVLRAVSRVNPKAAKLKKRLLGLIETNEENFQNQAISVAKRQLASLWADDADSNGRVAAVNRLEAEKRSCWERLEDLLGEHGAEYLNRLVDCEVQIQALSRRGELVALTEQIVLEHIANMTHAKEKHVSQPAC